MSALLKAVVAHLYSIPTSNPFMQSQGYFIQHGKYALLVDPPAYSKTLQAEIEKLAPCGIIYMLLTHDDTVGTSRYSQWRGAVPSVQVVAAPSECRDCDVKVDVPARVWTPLLDATDIDDHDDSPCSGQSGTMSVALIPGHAQGHLAFQYAMPDSGETLLFMGDSLGPHYNHYSLDEQAESLRWLSESVQPTLLLPTHGPIIRVQSAEEWREAAKAFVRGLSSWKWPAWLGYPSP